MTRSRVALLVLSVIALALAGLGGVRAYENLAPAAAAPIPSTKVKRGDVVFTVTSQGSIQGGNSKMLTAPVTGTAQLVLTSLARSGELVKEGDVVAQFDTTEESFKLREAEADLLEAEQQVTQAQNATLAKQEELDYELIQARAELKLAEIECRRNELLPQMVVKQNELALEAAKDRLEKLERDYQQRRAAAQASIAIQEAARKKAQVLADTARRNIDLMTLKAPINGYVSVERNTNSNFFFPGMQFPLLQVGDMVRPGTAVAQIPDLQSWEVTAQISEQDRGHLATGQPADIAVVALEGRKHRGKITNLGGTTGPPWNRRFECKLSLDDPAPELRPGMSVRLVIRTQSLQNVLWLPAQALFEKDGRKFVYVSSPNGFVEREVEMVRRSESQVVVKGLDEAAMVALANPTRRQSGAGSKAASPMGGIAK